MELAIFLIFALLALGSALMVVLHPDPVKSTLSLVVTLFATAVLFILLGAPFIAALQVLVYTGAIVVLFLFVVMLLNLQREPRSESGGVQRWIALAAGAVFIGVGGLAVWRSARGLVAAPLGERLVSLELFSTKLFSRYLLPFEIIGLLLLVAVVAAYVLAKRVDQPAAEGAGVEAEAGGDAPAEAPR